MAKFNKTKSQMRDKERYKVGKHVVYIIRTNHAQYGIVHCTYKELKEEKQQK